MGPNSCWRKTCASKERIDHLKHGLREDLASITVRGRVRDTDYTAIHRLFLVHLEGEFPHVKQVGLSGSTNE